MAPVVPSTIARAHAAVACWRERYGVAALIIGFGLFVIVLAWGVVLFKIASERALEIRTVVRENTNLARAFEEHIGRTMKNVDQVSAFLKYQYEKQGRKMDIGRYVSEGMIAADIYHQLGVIDEHGDYILSNLPAFLPVNLADREHFQVHVKQDSGKLFISKPVLGKASGKWSLNITRRVNKPDGSFGGVIVISVDPHYFSSFYRQVDVGAQGLVSLVGRDGIVRARQATTELGVGQDISHGDLFASLARSPDGTFESAGMVDGVRRFSSYRSVENYPLVVVVGRSQDEALAAFNERKRAYIISATLLTALIGILSAILVITIARLNRSAAGLRASQIKAESDKQLSQINHKLHDTEKQLLQSEKMASIGQLAAGVAHEINNPIGYVNSNLGSLEGYVQQVFEMMDASQSAESSITDAGVRAKLERVKQSIDLPFLRQDMVALIGESKEGISRVRKIVLELKDFSRVDFLDEWQFIDLHTGIDSTLNIVGNEIKYKAQVVKHYGKLPQIECLPSRLNQVFMNMLVNAAHAIERQGTITIRTGAVDANEVWVEFADTGKGIAADNLKRIFEPFFTTNPIGIGTGLGLSVSYGIVAKHHGHIDVQSELGKGTTFRITLPVQRKQDSSPQDAPLAQAA